MDGPPQAAAVVIDLIVELLVLMNMVVVPYHEV
jgi:hypothetical protein